MRVLCPGNDTRLKRSTIVLVIVWFSLSYSTYGVATWNNQLFADVGLSNPYLCSFIYSISTLPGNVGSIFLVGRVSCERKCCCVVGVAYNVVDFVPSQVAFVICGRSM